MVGGEDDEGNQAGFFMTVAMSRAADALQIEINNDSALFLPDDNAFASYIGTELFGK